MRTAMENCFVVTADMKSHARKFSSDRFDYSTDGEYGGQLVRCLSGELELFGHAGEWVIPQNHMVFIPANRVFQLRARIASTGTVIKFCDNEVSWEKNGCWVCAVGDFPAGMIDYALKAYPSDQHHSAKSRSFFVTLGDMVPAWFKNERIMWTPYAENSAIQKVIDFAIRKGPGVSLPEAARHAGMSERTLRRHIQSELGQSWRDFIREMRMNRAMELLRKDGRSVTETAFEVGFSSSSAFSSAFHGYVGKTPSVYAKASSVQARNAQKENYGINVHA